MFDEPPENMDNSDDEFEKSFAEFAEAKASPAQTETIEPDQAEVETPKPEPSAETTEKVEEVQEAKETETPSATSEGADKVPAEEKAPDPWANAPAELIAERDRLQAELEKVRYSDQSQKNRVAALSRKLHSLTTQTAPAAKVEEAEPTEAQKALDDKIKQLKEDYPQIADPLIEVIQAQRDELNTVKQSIGTVTEERRAAMIATEAEALTAMHPDWQEIAQSKDFAGWLEVQPENIQRLATSWDARETSVALTLFKSEKVMPTEKAKEEAKPDPKPETTATSEKRAQQLEGGRDVASKPASQSSGPPDDYEAAFKYFEKKKLAEQAGLRR